MYKEMFADINRHILVVWQSVAVLVGSFAILSLVEKDVIPLDIAAALIVLLCAWLFAHLFDAAYWYNRNLVIIANIERQFLTPEDLKNIHYYWGQHRPNNRMLTHLKIQFALGVGVVTIMLAYHFANRIIPGFDAPIANFEFMRALPYVTLIIATLYVCSVRNQRLQSYREFLRNSPGIDVDTSGIEYGVGHAHDSTAE